jgi:hypothetical protein
VLSGMSSLPGTSMQRLTPRASGSGRVGSRWTGSASTNRTRGRQCTATRQGIPSRRTTACAPTPGGRDRADASTTSWSAAATTAPRSTSRTATSSSISRWRASGEVTTSVSLQTSSLDVRPGLRRNARQRHYGCRERSLHPSPEPAVEPRRSSDPQTRSRGWGVGLPQVGLPAGALSEVSLSAREMEPLASGETIGRVTAVFQS